MLSRNKHFNFSQGYVSIHTVQKNIGEVQLINEPHLFIIVVLSNGHYDFFPLRTIENFSDVDKIFDSFEEESAEDILLQCLTNSIDTTENLIQ